MLLRDLVAQNPEQRAEWIKKVRGPANGQMSSLDLKLRALEEKHGMTTEEMRAAFKRGEVKDTAEIARWLVLARVRG